MRGRNGDGVARRCRVEGIQRVTGGKKCAQHIHLIQRTFNGQGVIGIIYTVLSPVTDVCGADLKVCIESSVFPNYILCLVTHLTGEGEDRFLDIL